jgi:hypothetical protein
MQKRIIIGDSNLELRSKVKVQGIPFTWETNLSDDEIAL